MTLSNESQSTDENIWIYGSHLLCIVGQISVHTVKLVALWHNITMTGAQRTML